MCMLAPGFMQGDQEQEMRNPRAAAVRRVALAEAEEDLVSRIPVIHGISAGISLAAAGDMALSREPVLPSRSRLCERLGIRRQRLYGARQVHSHRVLVVEGQSPTEVAAEEADGLLTRSADAVLSVTVADCLPIFLADRRTGAFGIVHSGWKGTGIVREAIRLLVERLGSRRGDIAVLIGPGIGACCYTVPPERAALFAERYGPAAVIPDAGRPRLDLREANLLLLREAGIGEVTVVTDCTSCSPRLGSFRRQGPDHYTLMLAWIGRGPEANSP
jgi:YfiH family protein